MIRIPSLILLLILSFTLHATPVPENLHGNDFNFLNFHLYHGENQRGGPFSFDDQYFEVEFGGRSGLVDLYGYVDFKDIFSSSNSDAHDGANLFADIEVRLSLDYMFGRDLSVGIIEEWYIATDLYYGDNKCAQTCVVDFDQDTGIPETTASSGLKILWVGIGTDMNLPWLGKAGVNFYTRRIKENYGAANENSWDGYVFHINWFKPLNTFSNGAFLAFQGYLDYEFGSDLVDDGNEFEEIYRTDSSLQTYWGLWYHYPDAHFKAGFGLKFYDDMTQWKDGQILGGREVDTTGVAQYFNITYAF